MTWVGKNEREGNKGDLVRGNRTASKEERWRVRRQRGNRAA